MKHGGAFKKAILAGLALAIAACGGPPPGTGGTKDGGASGTGTNDASTTATAASTPNADGYDYKTDPYVNPAQTYEQLPEGSDKADMDEVLVRCVDGNVTNLNPLFSSSLVDSIVQDILFSSAFTWGADLIWKTNSEVAESYTESEDHLTGTLKLKPGLKWQDGQPFVAKDFAFSFNAIMDERVNCPAVKDGTDQIASVEAPDDLTVVFKHKEALATNKWNICYPVIPAHIYDNAKERGADPSLNKSDYYLGFNNKAVVGSGPYKLAEYVPNERIVMERWDGYWGKKPHFKKIIFKIVPLPQNALLLFKKGEVDTTGLLSQQFIKETNDEAFRRRGVKLSMQTWNFNYIGWNQKNPATPFFADVKVRRALAHAMNTEKVIRDVYYGLASPCHGMFSPGAWMFNKEVKRYEYDLKKAAAMLDEAGWTMDEADGWRHKTLGGKNVKFEFELLIPEGGAASDNIVAIYQQDLKNIGVSMKTRKLEWAAFQDEVRKHNFQAEIAGLGTGVDPDTGWNLWHSSSYGESGRNYGGYNNPRVDELYVKGRHEFDPVKRGAIYAEIQKLVYEDQPQLFLVNPLATAAFDKRIRGVTTSPRGVNGFDPGPNGWWVARGETLRK